MSKENEDFIANDLSFLEDLDIDGIVEYLNETDNVMHTKRKEYAGPKLMPQDTSQTKRIKINTSKSQTLYISRECNEQLVENNHCLVAPLKVNITIKSIHKDCASKSTKIENTLQKCKENKQIFLAATDDQNIIITNNNDNDHKLIRNLPKLVENDSEKNGKSAQNTDKQFIMSISDLDDYVQNYTKISKVKDIESMYKSHLLPVPENVKDKPENVPVNMKDTSTKDDNKIDIISTNNESRLFSHDSKQNLESNKFEKQNSLEENKIYGSKITKLLSASSTDVRNEESKIILHDSNENLEDNKSKNQYSLKDNKIDDCKMTKLSSAISVVIRKEDLCLQDKLQNRLYQFLRVKFSDLNVFHYGRYSKIFECQQKGKKYALKVINPDLGVKQFGTEKGKMLNNLQHGILRDELHFVYLFASFGLEMSWCFLFDFYPTNLREELQTHGPMHIRNVEHLSRQLITALNRLRSQHIIHSDIKPEHILLNESTSVLKLCGFDRAYHVDEENILPNIGTPSYRAPEVILGYSASFSIDMWSSGLVMYEMMTDIRLFPGCFNNYILFKQMCILGNMPLDMVTNSIYGANHFIKRKFLKRGLKGKDIRVIDNFFKNNSYKKEPYKIYNKYWRCATSKALQEDDIKTITKLVDIIDKMLVLHPDDRIPIEVLYDDPFMLKSCY